MKPRTLDVFAGLLCLVAFDGSYASAQTNSSPAPKAKIALVPNTSEEREVRVKTADGTTNTVLRMHREKLDMREVGVGPVVTRDMVAYVDPKTHFVAWTIERDMKPTSIEGWLAEMWAIPDWGLVRVLPNGTGILMEIYRGKATDLNEWKRGFLEKLAIGQEEAPPDYKRVAVGLARYLGVEFFDGPACKILSVKCSARELRVEVQSGVTTDKAVVCFDPAFKLVRAFLNDKPVYPVTADVPKAK